MCHWPNKIIILIRSLTKNINSTLMSIVEPFKLTPNEIFF